MKRKVSQVGPATLMVSLPSKWVKKYGVKKGDEIDLEENESKLVLSTKLTKNVRKLSLKLDKSYVWFIKWLMNIIYKSGYDEIELYFKDPDLINQIQKQMNLNNLYGYEIISYDENKCILKDVTNLSEEDFQMFYKRSFSVTLEMLKSCYGILKSGNYENLKNILILEETNNKLVSICERIINKQNFQEEKKVFYYISVWLLEKIADYVRDLSGFVINHKKTEILITEEVLGVFGDLVKMYDDFFTSFFTPSKETLKKVIENNKKITSELEDLMNSSTRNENYILISLRDINLKISEFIGVYLGVNLDKIA